MFFNLGPSTPIFFILSPGVNPLKDVEALGKKLGYSTVNKNFHNVSLGQGQETVAEDAMAIAARGTFLFCSKSFNKLISWNQEF